MQTECTRSPAINEGEQNGFHKLRTTPSMKTVAQTKLHQQTNSTWAPKIFNSNHTQVNWAPQ